MLEEPFLTINPIPLLRLRSVTTYPRNARQSLSWPSIPVTLLRLRSVTTYTRNARQSHSWPSIPITLLRLRSVTTYPRNARQSHSWPSIPVTEESAQNFRSNLYARVQRAASPLVVLLGKRGARGAFVLCQPWMADYSEARIFGRKFLQT